MDQKRIAQTAAIALKIAKKFEKNAQWSKKNKIYKPLKRHKNVNVSKLTAQFIRKVQHTKDLRAKAERMRKCRDHASRTHDEEIQHASHTHRQKKH